MRILITGASGFVGLELTRSLSQAGHDVIGLSRTRPVEWASEYIETDLSDLHDLTDRLRGIDALVHLASRVHQGNESSNDLLPIYRRQNTEASVNLAKCAKAAGIRKFIFVSSVKAAGEGGKGVVFRSGDPALPTDPYGISKLEAEQGLRSLTDESFEIVSLRPPLVYGPGVKANFLQLVRFVEKGIPLPLASIRNRRSVVFVGNLVSAIIACLNAPHLDGKSYYISDGEPLSTAEMIKGIAAAMGMRPNLVSFPFGFLRVVGALTGQSGKVSRLTEDLEVDGRDFEVQYSWRPPISSMEGFRKTVEWYSRTRGK